MTWLAPGAFAAFVLLGGPVLVHLLARRNARRLIFPATHFVRATQAAAVRLRRPSDVGLLLLRLAIVTAAVLAAAQPLVMSRWRLARWNARIARVVVVDTSPGMPADPAEGRPATPEAALANRLGNDAMRGAFASRRFNAPDLADGIARAVEWLGTAPPARREIVLISDFRIGALDEGAVGSIPSDVGIRVIRAGTQPATRRVTAPPVEGWRGGIWEAVATIDAAGTRTSWRRRGHAGMPQWISVMAAPADIAAADRALGAAVSLGVPAGDAGHRVLVRFAGAPPLLPAAQPVRSAWIAAAAFRLHDSELLKDVDGLSVSERDGVLVVDVPIAASALAAPALVRAAALAVRPAALADTEAEVVTLPDADLARWRRGPAPVTRLALPIGGETDSRWMWAIALALLVVEGRVRQPRGRAREREAHADAA